MNVRPVCLFRALLFCLMWAGAALMPGGMADGETVSLEVTPTSDGVRVPVRVELNVLGDAEDAVLKNGKTEVAGQIDDGMLWWILPGAKKGETQTWKAVLTDDTPGPADASFSFAEVQDKHLDVLWKGRGLTRFMVAYDPSTKAARELTKKPFHHVFDAGGREFITKGAGGLFPHHRGIFIGWSRLGFGGKRFDTWHLNKGESQQHRRVVRRSAGAVFARTVSEIVWRGDDSTPVLDEEREVTVFAPATDGGAFLIDFESRLTASYGEVILDGDPEHAGCQFRPHDAVAEAKNARYLFHGDAIDPKKDRDLPWVALTYALGEREYNVQHMSHPTVPKGNVYSAYRDYGRFGAFCKAVLEKGETLTLRYRFSVAPGGLAPRSAYADRYEAFARPPVVKVVR